MLLVNQGLTEVSTLVQQFNTAAASILSLQSTQSSNSRTCDDSLILTIFLVVETALFFCSMITHRRNECTKRKGFCIGNHDCLSNEYYARAHSNCTSASFAAAAVRKHARSCAPTYLQSTVRLIHQACSYSCLAYCCLPLMSISLLVFTWFFCFMIGVRRTQGWNQLQTHGAYHVHNTFYLLNPGGDLIGTQGP